MRVLIVGGDGRAHALAWSLARSPRVDKLFAAPGNAGIAALAECFPDAPADPAGIAALADELSIDLTVVSPEAPLVAGLADELLARDLPVFGPTKAAARIEGSKSWAKRIMADAGAPTARAEVFTDAGAATRALDSFEPPYVVKADGLAAGKGVVVTPVRAEAEAAIEACFGGAFGSAGQTVLIEEFLDGEELSIFCVTDGETVLPLAAAQDYKRAFDGDEGPNTGGMGAYSPVPHMPADIVERSVRDIFEPVVRAMAAAGAPYRGVLYGGLMVTREGPRVFEFNCRLGDPEAQVVLPRLASDLADVLMACADGTLGGVEPAYRDEACVTVVLASGGYPGSYETGKPIAGLDEAAARDGVTVFHAGTALRDGRVVTAGGRVLAVSALGADIASARAAAYDAASVIDFKGKRFRTDIAARAIRGKG